MAIDTDNIVMDTVLSVLKTFFMKICQIYRPGKDCKLCGNEFESEFTDDSAREHYDVRKSPTFHPKYRHRLRKVFPAKFLPCFHQVICAECAKNEKYLECIFCSEPIRRVTHEKIQKYPQYADITKVPDWKIYYSNNIAYTDCLEWRCELLYSNSD